ncbi:MFS transporter [Actinomadura barringtoniae]|uniref:MFS transporter n=1 Tax=Actinomadura barringtoniae TaxID=1427535 RepID=A0A939PF64_9ACTN|nr:MFS transporter [Actinomadura barringtoniae]MBO2448069.1 MFS transporter [Actinomadura barringtoniae]
MITQTRPGGARAVRQGPMLAVLLTGQAMASMDGSIVSVAAQTIREDLGAGGTAVQLVVSGYLLTTGLLLVTCARLGDIIGHRRAFLIGLGWFTAASLVCGLAPNATSLVLARVAQAVGAALLMPQVFSLIQLHWDGAARRRAIGLYSMVLSLGVALGQILGGLITTVSWRPAFLINLPIGVVLLVVGSRTLVEGERASARLDLGGVGLLTGAMGALVGPLIFGRDYGWPVWVWVSLACGAVLLVAFVAYERHKGEAALLNLAALRPRGVKPGLAACWIVMGCYTVFLLTLTLHLQSALGFSPLEAGLAFVPYALGFGSLSLSWTRYPLRLQNVLPVAGPIAFAACATGLVLLAKHQWPVAASIPLLYMAGAGHAAGYSPLIARLTTLVDASLASALSGLNSTGPLLAGVICVAGLGSVYFAAPTSADGLLRVTASIAALLAVGAACAYRVRAYRVRSAGPS